MTKSFKGKLEEMIEKAGGTVYNDKNEYYIKELFEINKIDKNEEFTETELKILVISLGILYQKFEKNENNYIEYIKRKSNITLSEEIILKIKRRLYAKIGI